MTAKFLASLILFISNSFYYQNKAKLGDLFQGNALLRTKRERILTNFFRNAALTFFILISVENKTFLYHILALPTHGPRPYDMRRMRFQCTSLMWWIPRHEPPSLNTNDQSLTVIRYLFSETYLNVKIFRRTCILSSFVLTFQYSLLKVVQSMFCDSDARNNEVFCSNRTNTTPCKV